MNVAIVLLPTRSAEFSINIRLTHDRKSKYLSIGKKVFKEQFKENAVQNWVIKHPDAIFINREIEEKRRRAVNFISTAELDEQEITFEQVIDAIKGKSASKTDSFFFGYLEERWKYYFQNDQITDYYRYKRYRQHLEQAWGKDYPIQKITLELVQQYHLYRKKAGVSNNTIKKELDDMGNVFKKKLPGVDNPFKDHRKTIHAVPIKKHKLTKTELEQIENCTVLGKTNLAKDMFLFAFYAHGMRFENVALLEKEAIKKVQIEYQMNKGKKHREILIHPKLQAIIDKYKKGEGPYLFPIIKEVPVDAWDKRSKVGSATSDINDELKIVGAAAGLTVKLTFHLARHSFAYNAMKANVAFGIIKNAMGHSSSRTTEMYLGSFNDEEINEALKGMYE